MITEEQKHQCKYFIKKFEATRDDEWCVGSLHNEQGQSCALGKTGTMQQGQEYIYSDEAIMLKSLLEHDRMSVWGINDGDSHKYRQSHPKQRILAALHDRLKQ
jgi:hypothetical protein